MTKHVIFATLDDHPQNRSCAVPTEAKLLLPGDLVAVVLPPNCSVDGVTSETRQMLGHVLQHLQMCARRHQELSHGIDLKGNAHHLAADELGRALTLLGAPRDASRDQLRDAFDAGVMAGSRRGGHKDSVTNAFERFMKKVRR